MVLYLFITLREARLTSPGTVFQPELGQLKIAGRSSLTENEITSCIRFHCFFCLPQCAFLFHKTSTFNVHAVVVENMNNDFNSTGITFHFLLNHQLYSLFYSPFSHELFATVMLIFDSYEDCS